MKAVVPAETESERPHPGGLARYAWWRWARSRAEGRAIIRSTGRLLGVTPGRRARLVERRGRQVGKPPGELEQVPDAAPSTISAFILDAEGELHERTDVTAEEAAALAGGEGVTWIDIEGTADTETIARLGEAYGLHPLVQEDIAHAHQRPKLEPYGEDRLFVVVRMVKPGAGPSQNGYADGRPDHQVEQVAFVLCPKHLLSFQEGIRGDVFEPVRSRMRARSQRFKDAGPDYILYALLDVIVDHYFVTLEHIGDATETFEDAVYRRPTPATLGAIQSLRRETLVLRRTIWPLREVLSSLMRDDSPLITDRTRRYLRDVYDHLIQAVDTVEVIRDVLEGLVDHYLTALSYRTNEIMRVLTLVGTVFLPLTFITSIYGMNFDPHVSDWNMPELLHPYGYPILMGFLLVVAIGILLMFRRRGYVGGPAARPRPDDVLVD